MSSAILRVEGLEVRYPVRRGRWGGRGASLQAVAGVDLALGPAETLGIVGESGSGKSSLARAILRLVPLHAGRIEIAGVDFGRLRGRALRRARRRAQMVFQDPYASLDPRMRVAEIVAEPLVTHGLARSRAERERMVAELVERVGLGREHLGRHPHELSGGQRQRVGIARAIAPGPALVVADEPVSALDASVRSHIVALLARLQRELEVSYLFISHDLAVVRHLSHRIAVMYLGRIVEHGATRSLFERPAHPYTQALLAAQPTLAIRGRKAGQGLPTLGGEPPDPAAPPSGCAFRTRCPYAFDRCALERPILIRTRDEAHWVACHLDEPPPA